MFVCFKGCELTQIAWRRLSCYVDCALKHPPKFCCGTCLACTLQNVLCLILLFQQGNKDVRYLT